MNNVLDNCVLEPKSDCGWPGTNTQQCPRTTLLRNPGFSSRGARVRARAVGNVRDVRADPSVSVPVSRLKWWGSCVLCLSYARLCPDHMDGSQRSTAPQRTRHARSRRPNEDREVLECGLDRAASAAIPPRPCSWLHTVLVAYWSMVAAIAHRHNTPHTPCTPII